MEPTPGAGTRTQPVQQNGAESPLVVSPHVALVITFIAKKHRKILKRVSEWSENGPVKWGSYMKGINNDELPRLKMFLPPARKLVGLADGRVICFWDTLTENSNETAQRFLHDLNTAELKTSLDLAKIHSIVIFRKPSISINAKAFTSTVLDQGEVLTPKWFTPLIVGDVTPKAQKLNPPKKASAKKALSKTQVKDKPKLAKRTGEPLEDPREAKRVALDVAPETAFSQSFAEFCNTSLNQIKVLDYKSIFVLEQILQAVKGKMGTLSLPAVISTLQARDSSPLKLSLSLLEVLDVHHSLLLSLSRNGSNMKEIPQQTTSVQRTSPTRKQLHAIEGASSLCGIYPSIMQTLERQGCIQKQVDGLLQSVSSSTNKQTSGTGRPASQPGAKEGVPKPTQELNVKLDADVIQERLQRIDYQRNYWKLACSTDDLHSRANPFSSTLRNFMREARALVSLLEMVLRKGSGEMPQNNDTTSIETAQPNCTNDSDENMSIIPSPSVDIDQEKLRELGDRLTQTQAELEEANRLRSIAEGEVRRTKQEKKLLEGQLTNSLLARRSTETTLKAELARRMQAEQTVRSLLDIVVDVENAFGFNSSVARKMPETLRSTVTI